MRFSRPCYRGFCLLILISFVSSYTTLLFSQPSDKVDQLDIPVSPILARQLAVSTDSTLFNIQVITSEPDLLLGWCRSKSRKNPLPVSDTVSGFIIPITKSELPALARLKGVTQVELWRQAHTDLKQEGMDLSLNEVSLAHHLYPDLSGTPMIVSIKENRLDSTDIDFKNRIVPYFEFLNDVDLHATNMGSIIGGGANSDVHSKGVAWDATMLSSSFIFLFPSDAAFFQTHQITVQNHSYGTGIENFYGPESVKYDELCNELPDLMHIFSAGNAGDQTSTEGTYANLTGWANLTGQFKQSKNTISVGATDSTDHVVPLSSRGPAYDGRIKPEIVAYGHGGTSGAAAIISGASLLLQQRYAELNNGEIPPSSLTRAILINTAKDIETPGPDFISGYGSLRLAAAIETIDKENYIVDYINHLDSKGIPFTIPDDVAEVKIMIAWNDPAHHLNASLSLINNLDITLENLQTGEIIYPWILSSFPSADSLAQPARRGSDSINNVEQITITDPVPGEYIIHIHGTAIQTSTQTFALTWQLQPDETFHWTFPTRSDFLQPGNNAFLRWSSPSIENGTIQYRTLPGGDWIEIASIDLRNQYVRWSVPDYSIAAQLRMITDAGVFESDSFLITTPLRPEVILVCEDSIILAWPKITLADSFELFRIGEKHMEHVEFLKDTFKVILPDYDRRHFAVAYYEKGIRSPLGYTGDFLDQAAGCYINQFYHEHTDGDTAYFKANLGTTEGVYAVSLQILEQNQFVDVDIQTPVSSTSLDLEYDPLLEGRNVFRLHVLLNNGIHLFSEEVEVYFQGNEEIVIYPSPGFFGRDVNLYIYDADEFDVEIYDATGRLVWVQRNNTSPQVTMYISQPPGLFFIMVTTNDRRIFSKKMVIIW